MANTSSTDHTPTAAITRLVIDLPDDFHHHARDGTQTAAVLQHAQQRFGRCLLMPNLKPPLVTTELVLQYRDHVLQCLKSPTTLTKKSTNHHDASLSSSSFQPLFTLYLTDFTTPDEIQKAHDSQVVVAAKYYPAGATTHSEFGVTNPQHLYPVFSKMQHLGMVLCLHSEVTYGDIFERETIFLQTILQPLMHDFPQLKITVEHISTQQAVEFVTKAPDNVKATITCHHLLYNRNGMTQT
jgi:dihydroorotase